MSQVGTYRCLGALLGGCPHFSDQKNRGNSLTIQLWPQSSWKLNFLAEINVLDDELPRQANQLIMQKLPRHLSLLLCLMCWLVVATPVFSKAPVKHSTTVPPPLPYVDSNPITATKSSTATANTTALLGAVREAKIINPAFELHLVIEGDTAKVNTAREVADKEDDCKIDAVIIGKTIMAKDPAIKKTIVLFHPDSQTSAVAGNDDKAWRVVVTDTEIEQFKSGNMNQQALLSLLVVQHVARKGAKSQTPQAFDGNSEHQPRGRHPHHEPGVWQSSARVHKDGE